MTLTELLDPHGNPLGCVVGVPGIAPGLWGMITVDFDPASPHGREGALEQARRWCELHELRVAEAFVLAIARPRKK